jgi:hypothetical protein
MQHLFRATFEDLSFPILPEFYQELLAYRHRHCAELLTYLQSQNIELSTVEQKQLLPTLPVLFHANLFKAKFNTKSVLLA